MSSSIHCYLLLFTAFSNIFLLSHISALPITEMNNPYDTFIDFLVRNNCSMPTEIELPFSPPPEGSPFNYLSDPLKECQTADAVRDADEAKFLCREIFDVLENITCVEYNTPLPKITANPLSKITCQDFEAMKDLFPKEKDYLSSRLVDSTLCKLLCSPQKYDNLCKTLLWTHDLQAKIKVALAESVKEDPVNKNDSKMGPSSLKINLTHDETDSDKYKSTEKVAKNNVDIDDEHSKGKQTPKKDSTLNIESAGSITEKKLNIAPQTVSDRTNTPTSNRQTEKSVNMTTIPETSKVSEENMKTKQVSPIVGDKIINDKNGLQSDKSNQNVQSRNNDQNGVTVQLQSTVKNSIPVGSQTENLGQVDKSITYNQQSENENIVDDSQQLAEKGKDNIHLQDNYSTKTLESSPKNDNENGKNNLKPDVEDKSKQISNTSVSNLSNTKSSENVDDLVPKETEMDNELNDVNLGKNEAKTKPTTLKTADKNKMSEKPELTDFETPIGGAPKTDTKVSESTTFELTPDKDEDNEHEEEKEQEQYNNSFNSPLKNKEVDTKSSDMESSNQNLNSYDTFISSRNNIGRIPDDMPLISSVSEQEDGHFFSYVLSIVIIVMAGYLIFHNKQKIIALIVEGRHERRRRSHGSGYKKLETK